MKRGDIVQLGRHRLMCGDAAVADDVSRLMAATKAAMMFTSPPYPGKRIYGDGVNNGQDWTTIMVHSCQFPHQENCQVIVNLGMVHSECEWQPYWTPWLDSMRNVGWRRFALYVWDQGFGLPGDWRGRLAPSHEFLFHLNKVIRIPEKIMRCKSAGVMNHATGQTRSDGKPRKERQTWVGRPISLRKKSDSVIRVTRQMFRDSSLKHNAQFPPRLAELLKCSYCNEGEVVYDPFSGVGSSVIGADACNRTSYSMEIEPDYCDMTIARYRKHLEKVNSPAKPKRKVLARA